MNKFHFKAIILILLTAIVVYAHSLFNPFIWDDKGLIVDNFLIKDWRYIGRLFATDLYYSTGRQSNFYRPLQSLSYMFDYSLWKLNPFGYHFTNIILHISVAILAYFFFFLISQQKKVSLIAALLFAVHPVHAEAVTYISGRADPLMGLFLLLSFILFIKYIHAVPSRKAYLYLGSLACFLLSLLSKEAALIFPLALLLTKMKFIRKEAKVKFLHFLPFFILACGYALFRFALPIGSGVFFVAEYPFKIRLFIFLKVIVTYLGLLLLPLNLHMSRNVTLPHSLFDWPIFGSFLLLILILSFIFRTYRRFPLISFSWAWFFIFLFPQSGLLRINAFLAEHFLYLPSLGLFLLASWSLMKIFPKKIITYFLVCILAFYSFFTIRRNLEWRDPLTFYEKAIRLSPYSFALRNQLALLYLQQGLYDKAISEYDIAIKIKEDFSEAYLNRAIAYYKNGQEDKAVKQSLELIARCPDCDFAQSGLAGIYAENKEYQKAIEKYKEAIRISPERPKFYNLLGLVYHELGEFDLAMAEFKKGIKIDHQDPILHNNLGTVYKLKGQMELAIGEYYQALRLKPDLAAAYNNLGIVFSMSGQYTQAETSLKQAIQIESDYPDAHYNLGVVYWKQGQWDKCISQLQKVLDLAPEHRLAKEWLKRAREKTK